MSGQALGWTLRARSDERELLDQGLGSESEVRASLLDMDRINRVLGGSAALRGFLRRKSPAADPQERVRILDAGCGSARMTARMAAGGLQRVGWAVGVDCERRHLQVAREARVPLVQAELTALPFRDGAFDLAFSTLTLHHLNPSEAVACLREIGRVTRRWAAVNDLVRSRLSGWAFRLIAPLLGCSRLTLHDGLASIRRAYTPREFEELALRAGCVEPEVERQRLMFRMTLVFRGGAQ